ncbi:VOC family protein [Mycobacterium sherrisii]|uniref:VOC family protein n=1 Tax=Mycobacterium sherrisii TaxID=243061 RepID=UPI0039763974
MGIDLLYPNIEIGVVTTNVGRIIEFYENFLGLPLREELGFPGGAQRRYAVGKNTLKLVTYDQSPAARTVPGGGRTQEGIRYFSLYVSDIAAVAGRIADSPYELVEPLTEFTAIPGWSWLFAADPDGNWVELAGPHASTSD